MIRPVTIWAFDLGKGSIGEAVRDVQTNQFLHTAALLLPPDLAQRGPASQSGTPASRYRAWKVRHAHRERERWLDTVWRAAGLTPLRKREVWRNPATGRWELKHPADYRLEREFAPSLGEKTRDGAPSDVAGANICYTSCLLRIKLLRWKRGDPRLEEWQVYKALRSAMQKRGYGRVPWAVKEARAQGKTPEELEAEEQKQLEQADPRYREAAGKWPKFKRAVPAEFHFPCYYDAFHMGLWSPDQPDQLRLRPDHRASSTRNVRFDRADVRKELIALGNNAAAMLPQLQQAFERWQRAGWKFPHPVTGQELTYPVRARTFGEFLCDGPAGQPDETSFEAFLNQRRAAGIRIGTFEEWMAALGQKTPRFDNRIVENCALIPRLHVCKVAPRWRRNQNGDKELDPRSLLAAEVTFLLQLKNLQVDDATAGTVRYLNTDELNEWWKHACEKAANVPLSDTWERDVLDCFKITRAEWRRWCVSKNLLPVARERSEAAAFAGEIATQSAEAASGDSGAEERSRGKSQDVVQAPKPTGRSRFCRPALAILRHLLLHREKPQDFAARLRNREPALLDALDFDVLDTAPAEERPTGNGKALKRYRKQQRTWLLTGDLDFLDHVWKATDRDGNPRDFEPHQLRIPDMTLRDLRKRHDLTETPYSELLRQNSAELERRDKAIVELIGQQKNPVVRDRLTRFWQRLKHFQNPVVPSDPKKQKPGLGLADPACLVLEFVRDDKDNSLEGRKRTEAIQQALRENEQRRDKARKALEQCGLPTTDDMVVRWLLREAQGGVCIYTSNEIRPADLPNLQIEHIVPQSRGGPDAFWNWVLCDENANAEKGDRVPYVWFKEEKTDEEWADYKRRVLARAAQLGRRKVDLLLRPDAAELVGEKYTALAESAWIARLAQTIARLHFGWPLDDEPGEERVITISGGLTARIRRKYLLDSLLGVGNDAETLRREIDSALDELEALRTDTSLSENARKQKRAELRQRLANLAAEAEKNRDDQRHHALDAMLLTFLPNWARDRNKEDFFRFPTAIGDTQLYSEHDQPRIAAIKSELARLYEENKPVFREIKQARLAGDFGRLQQLKASVFPARKRIAELYRALDKLKQPRNVRAVREWFRSQLEGASPAANGPVLPRTMAWQRTPTEATLYRRVYLIYKDCPERSLLALTDLAFAPNPRNPQQPVFDLKWLRTRIQSIAEHPSYDRKKLQSVLSAKLEATLSAKRFASCQFGPEDWQQICAQPEVAACFQPVGRGKSKRPPEPDQRLVKVCKVEVLPATRYELSELGYTSGNNYAWNPDHLAETARNILRKDDAQARTRGRRRTPAPASSPSADASPWPGFLWDREMQAKLASPEFREAVEQQLVPHLLPPKPARMSDAERTDWATREERWKQAFEQFRKSHNLPKSFFIFTSDSDRPPRRPNVSLLRVLFEPKDKVFSRDALAKQAQSVVDAQLRRCLECFADSLTQVRDPRLQEKAWRDYCNVVRVVPKETLEQFTREHPTPTADQWISFFEAQTGPRIFQVMQTVGTSLEEYFDLSKDACGAFARGGNKGYWLCKRGDAIEARPIRFFENPEQVRVRLLGQGWELLDPKPWRTGDLLNLPEAAQSGARSVPAGYYFLGSFSNDTGVNLKPCFGGEVPQNVSLKALWNRGLRRCSPTA
jgi:CRISPR-associated endonuclease Csn1